MPTGGKDKTMKTLEEFVEELRNSEALQKEFCTISCDEELEGFLKKNDCEATIEDFVGFMQSALVKTEEGELSDEEAEAVAGGEFRDFLKQWLAVDFKSVDASIVKFNTKVTNYLIDTFYPSNPFAKPSCNGDRGTKKGAYSDPTYSKPV